MYDYCKNKYNKSSQLFKYYFGLRVIKQLFAQATPHKLIYTIYCTIHTSPESACPFDLAFLNGRIFIYQNHL